MSSDLVVPFKPRFENGHVQGISVTLRMQEDLRTYFSAGLASPLSEHVAALSNRPSRITKRASKFKRRIVHIQVSADAEKILTKKELEIKKLGRRELRIKNQREKLVVSSVALALSNRYNAPANYFISSGALSKYALDVISCTTSSEAQLLVERGLRKRGVAALRLNSQSVRYESEKQMAKPIEDPSRDNLAVFVAVEVMSPEEAERTFRYDAPNPSKGEKIPDEEWHASLLDIMSTTGTEPHEDNIAALNHEEPVPPKGREMTNEEWSSSMRGMVSSLDQMIAKL